MKATERPYANLRFCPWCSTETLERDRYRWDNEQKDSGGTEWICTNCGRGFFVTPSLRVQHGNRYAKDLRARRYEP